MEEVKDNLYLRNQTLTASNHTKYVYPKEGWTWFDTASQAYSHSSYVRPKPTEQIKNMYKQLLSQGFTPEEIKESIGEIIDESK